MEQTGTIKDLKDRFAALANEAKEADRIYRKWYYQREGKEEVGLSDIREAVKELKKQIGTIELKVG